MNHPEFSVIIPVYNSESYLKRLAGEISKIFTSFDKTFELILVNDCSPDSSLEEMRKLKLQNSFPIIIIDLKKNIGQYAATIVGLHNAEGKFMITADADIFPLQGNFRDLIKHVLPGTELIYGEQENTHIGFLRKSGSLLFNCMVRFSLNKRVNGNGSSFRLISRSLLNKVLPQIYEPLMLDIYLINASMDVRFIPLTIDSTGTSSYSFLKLISQGINLLGGLIFERSYLSKKFEPTILVGSGNNSGSQMSIDNTSIEDKTVYPIQINTLEGAVFCFGDFKGKKILIVNVASACGLTPQYDKLQKLYSEHKDRLVVIGVPCNDFAKQEPGTSEEIREFCDAMYGVTFPLTEKVNILNEPVHPLYNFLTKRELNGMIESKVVWNFQKYLLNEKGELTHYFNPDVLPDHEALLKAVST
ncbi:MAG: glycosyltransferase [Bacteroidota bacterium]